MRKAGQMAAEVLLFAGKLVAPGVTTDSIDAEVHDEIVRRGAYPSPLNYRGYPKSVCTSINEVHSATAFPTAERWPTATSSTSTSLCSSTVSTVTPR